MAEAGDSVGGASKFGGCRVSKKSKLADMCLLSASSNTATIEDLGLETEVWISNTRPSDLAFLIKARALV